MRNLLQIIVRFHFLILFLILEGIAFFLIVQNNKYHKAGFLNSSNFVTGKIFNRYDAVVDYFHLKDTNDSLVVEMARLQSQKLDRIPKSVKILNDTLIFDTSDIEHRRTYIYIPAKVIRNSINRSNNYIYINKGAKHGITKDMGVINADGVVGVIKSTSDNYSLVMSVLHKDLLLSAKLKKSNHFGSINWPGNDRTIAQLNYIPKHVQINPNDTVVTTGFTSFFPENIMIGTVISSSIIAGTNFQDIKIRLSTEFDRLSYVFVVNHIYKDEINELTKLVEE